MCLKIHSYDVRVKGSLAFKVDISFVKSKSCLTFTVVFPKLARARTPNCPNTYLKLCLRQCSGRNQLETKRTWVPWRVGPSATLSAVCPSKAAILFDLWDRDESYRSAVVLICPRSRPCQLHCVTLALLLRNNRRNNAALTATMR